MLLPGLMLAALLLTATTAIGAPGDPDTSFGDAGKVTAGLGSGADLAFAVALQSDGRILVAGYKQTALVYSVFAVVRLSAEGSLDMTFGGTGVVTTDPGFSGSAHAVAVQPDGRIVVVGSSHERVTVIPPLPFKRMGRSWSLEHHRQVRTTIRPSCGPTPMAL